MPRLRTCSAGLDGKQKGCVSQPGACGLAKPVPRPLLGKSALPSSTAFQFLLPKGAEYGSTPS